jgi:segregation and condensation protein B
MAAEEKSEKTISLGARIEALLFVAPGQVTPSHLAGALGVSVREVEAGLDDLENHYMDRGLRLQRYHGRYQITTAPGIASLVEAFLDIESTSHLSRASLETLAIIAYQQPVTRPQIDSIRGVNSDSVLKNLLSKGLVEEAGRGEGPGRPIFYITSGEFLQHFGLDKIEDLPALSLELDTAQDGDGGSPEQNGRPEDRVDNETEPMDTTSGG